MGTAKNAIPFTYLQIFYVEGTQLLDKTLRRDNLGLGHGTDIGFTCSEMVYQCVNLSRRGQV
jgi:hypothetical protein